MPCTPASKEVSGTLRSPEPVPQRTSRTSWGDRATLRPPHPELARHLTDANRERDGSRMRVRGYRVRALAMWSPNRSSRQPRLRAGALKIGAGRYRGRARQIVSRSSARGPPAMWSAIRCPI